MATLTATTNPTNSEGKRKSPFLSKPLFKQSLKSLLFLWIALTLGSALIFVIINVAVGSKSIFSNIDMDSVTAYIEDEGLQWLSILGLLEQMGFDLSRIQIMSQIDLNSILSELVYKITGILLPMIYVMIASNQLIAAQVSDGSMAYILSTPTNRRCVVRTQYIFLISSILVMYVIITGAAVGSEFFSHFATLARAEEGTVSSYNPTSTLLYCMGSFFAMFGLSGICFGASGWFNKSNYSIAIGGGACILSFLCTILGLFGNEVFVAVGVGVKAMTAFNYFSLFTLVDTSSMSAFSKALSGYDVVISFTWIWKLAILFGIGALFSFIGAKKFCSKDLPL